MNEEYKIYLKNKFDIDCDEFSEEELKILLKKLLVLKTNALEKEIIRNNYLKDLLEKDSFEE